MAAAYLVASLRANSTTAGIAFDRKIILIGEEPFACYNRILLSSVLAQRAELGDLEMIEEGADLDVRTGSRVAQIDASDCQVCLESGERIAYGDLVLATGSSVAMPIQDADSVKGVLGFRTLEDLRELQISARTSERAIVVGAGLLGLEAAWGLVGLGVEVTVVHRQQHILNRQLDADAAAVLQTRFEKEGVQFQLGSGLDEVLVNEGHVAGIATRDGSQIDGDLLVIATGIRPNVGLAVEAGLEVDRGILVNGWLATSRPHIYALGECIQAGADTFGHVAPIREQADILGRRLLDIDTNPFLVSAYPTQLKISGLDVFSAGDLDECAETITLASSSQQIYRRLFIRENQLVGAILLGSRRNANMLVDLIREGVDIRRFRNQLAFGALTPGIIAGL